MYFKKLNVILIFYIFEGICARIPIPCPSGCICLPIARAPFFTCDCLNAYEGSVRSKLKWQLFYWRI